MAAGSFLPGDLRTLLGPERQKMSMIVKTSTGVTISKPFWMSKKVILTTIAAVIAIYQAWTGNWDGLSAEELVAQIAKVTTILTPIVAAVLAIAKVDAQTQGAALITEGLKTLSSLDKPDISQVKTDTVRP